MLGRRKNIQDDAPATPDGPGKNRPTPKRRDVQAARKQPLVPTARPTGKAARGAAGKAAREAAREERVAARQRMMSGDERYLGARDRGPVRRFARDYVDSRWNLGELLLPVMVVVLLLSFLSSSLQSKNPGLYGGVLAVTYVMVLMSAVDAFWMSVRLKKSARAKFGDDVELKGISWYAVMRAFQLRRTRVPRAGVKRGELPS